MRAFLLLNVVLAAAGLLSLSGCGTVSDLVTSNIPDRHEGKASILIRLREQKAYLFKGKHEIAASRISSGREGLHTPLGRFRVLRKDQDHRSSAYGYYADKSGRAIKENVDSRKDRKPPNTHFVGASMPYYLEFSPAMDCMSGICLGFPPRTDACACLIGKLASSIKLPKSARLSPSSRSG
jgi:hypothetical protein